MVLPNEWEKEYGRISVVLEKITLQPSEIPVNKSKKIQASSSLSCPQSVQSQALLSPVPTNESMNQLFEKPQSISMTHQSASKIHEASLTSMSEQLSCLKTRLDTPTSLDSSISSGAMTDQVPADSTPKFVPTTTPAQVQLTVAKMAPSEVSFDSSSTTTLQGETRKKSNSSNELSMSTIIESSMSEHLVDSGSSNQPWLTTTSTTHNSPPMDTLSKTSEQVSTPNPVRTPQDEYHPSPPVQLPSDIEITDQSNLISNANNGNNEGRDGDEWEVLDETYVYADCAGAVESDLMQPGKSVLIVDLDSESPLIQIGPAIFQGTFEDCLGTDLIFEKHPPNSENSGAASSSTQQKPSIEIFASRVKTSNRPTFTYFGKTSKSLNLNRVFLKPKDNPP